MSDQDDTYPFQYDLLTPDKPRLTMEVQAVGEQWISGMTEDAIVLLPLEPTFPDIPFHPDLIGVILAIDPHPGDVLTVELVGDRQYEAHIEKRAPRHQRRRGDG